MTIDELQKKVRNRRQELIVSDDARYTAVLIPLIVKNGELYVLFEVRNSKIPQGNEICFPGGHVEENENGEDAVIRETCEELLLDYCQIEVIAPMHRLMDRGKYVIDSYLGIITDYQNTFSEDEVSSVFCVPLTWLFEHEPEIYPFEMVTKLPDDFPYELIPGGKDYPFVPISKRFYFYRYEEHIIWGLTGELLYRFVQDLKNKAI